MADVLNPAAPRRRGWRAFGPTGWAGVVIVALMLVACLATLPYTLGREAVAPGVDGTVPRGTAQRRFEAMNPDEALEPPSRTHLLGTDRLGRDLFLRCLAGGGLSLCIGIAAALVAVCIGTAYGTVSGYFGGRLDAAMMRFVDILFGLPNILLVVLLAVAVDGLLERGEWDLPTGARQIINVLTLLIAIGGVTWLTMARVIRGQVLSLKQQPFMEACRATGVPLSRQFFIHLLPNLLGPIIVYATLTVPNAILTESFLSFLGIGVKEPLPSWGNLAAAGLNELNIVRSRWWLLLWPCLFIGLTLLALNFVGEGLREALDPRRRAV
jgi:oligopeptide transport system permease protein